MIHRIHIIYLVTIGIFQVSIQTIIEYCSPWRKRKIFIYKHMQPEKTLEEMISPTYNPKYMRAHINNMNQGSL